ncbi:unnamed protein product [Prorocentrum cordatum]|uniref:FAST kinase leucine-rich domain-containing protein n=1 Tax=Prorocentrum cordatum TaxID=2364126 RepID=A0ABN9P8R9_9DINO|nr:unnamed protein product [Polarella glacialis]
MAARLSAARARHLRARCRAVPRPPRPAGQAPERHGGGPRAARRATCRPRQLEGRGVADCLGRAAELGFTWDARAAPPAELGALLDRVGSVAAEDLARLAAALGAMSLSGSPAASTVAAGAAGAAPTLGAPEAALLAQAFARLGRPEVVEAVAEAAAARAAAFGTRALVRVVCAAATARMRGSGAADAVLHEAADRGARLRPECLASLVWAMGRLRRRRERALAALLPHVSHRHKDLSPAALAHTLGGLSRLRPDGGRVGWLEEDCALRLVVRSLRHVSWFNPQELVILACAAVPYSTAGTRGGSLSPLVQGLFGELQERIGDVAPHHLSRAARALADLRHWDERFLDLLGAESMRRADQFRPQDAADMMMSVATLRYDNLGLVQALTAQFLARCGPDPPAAAVSDVAWAHATLGACGEALCRSGVLSRAAPGAREVASGKLAGLAWAAAALGSRDEALFGALAAEAERRGDLSPRDSARMLWALANAGFSEDRALASLARQFLAHASSPLCEEDRGENWAELAEALASPGATPAAPGSPRHEAAAAFRDAVYEPAVALLQDVAAAESAESRK